jgi:hypothetical protein
MRDGVLIAVCGLVALAAAFAAPWSAEQSSQAGALGLVAFVIAIFVGVGVVPALAVLWMVDRLRSAPNGAAWWLVRGLVFTFGVVSVAVGLLAAVGTLRWGPTLSGWKWVVVLTVVIPCATRFCLYGIHVAEIAIFGRSEHRWVRLVR